MARSATRQEHLLCRRYENKDKANTARSILANKTPKFQWGVRRCKRLDAGGYERGNPHYHVVIVKRVKVQVQQAGE